MYVGNMKVLSGILLGIFSFKMTLGGQIAELHAVTGIETCKKRCLQESACLAIIYDALHITCEIRFQQAKPPSLQGTFLARSEISLVIQTGETSCKGSKCTRSSCIVTRSYKEICRVRGCVLCKSPPRKDHADVTVSRFYNGATAKYTCHPNYSFFHRRRKHLRCFRNCTWETSDFVCTKELSTHTVELHMPFKENTVVRVCGKIRSPKQFTISFQKDGDVYFDIKQRFPSTDGRLKWQSLFGPSNRATFELPFKRNSNFCLRVTRTPRKYLMTVKKQKFSFPVRNNGEANAVVAENILLTQVGIRKC